MKDIDNIKKNIISTLEVKKVAFMTILKIRMIRIITIVYLICLIALYILYSWSINELNKKHVRVYPQIYKIYAPTVIDKIPEDIIEETELKIIKEAEYVELESEVILLKTYPEIKLNKKIGTVQGPQEIEKFYNLPMENVIQTMRNAGYTEEDYPYYISDDGIKMFGDFIIVAADLEKYPRGTIVETSLGQGMVCDTGEDLEGIFDLAVEW